MLSFTKGTPIAKIVGGKDDGRILRVTMDIDTKEDLGNEIFNIINTDFIDGGRRKRIDPMDIEKLKYAIKDQKEPKEVHLRDAYHRLDSLLKECSGKEYHIDDGELQQVPNSDLERECLYISGPSGSGKSTYINKFTKQYKKMFPDNYVFMLSRLTEDKSLDDNKHIKRIQINDDLLNDPIDNSELENSAIIFDDIDTIKDKELREYVQYLRDDLLETGRHEKVTMLCTSHLLMDYKKTRTLLNESTSVTFFPKSGTTYHIIRFLKTYCGLNKKQVERILSLPSRWITISKVAPMWILYNQGCYLL